MNRTTLILAAALGLSVSLNLVLMLSHGVPQTPVSCEFNESEYLQLNPDVARAVALRQFVSGRAHFDSFGRGEGRAVALNCPGMNTRDRGAEKNLAPWDFNEAHYLEMNPDVAAAVARRAVESGAAPYARFGKSEGRAPGFDCPGVNTLPK